MGFGAFHLADFDVFETANIQRQVGATVNSLGRPKVAVMAEIAATINPEVKIKTFPQGITPENIDEFLSGADIVVDGIEFFAIETRRMLYQAARRHGLPVVHAGPLGYGATLLTFMPDGVSFDEYFGMEEGLTKAEQLLAHALGHSRGVRSDVDPSRVDFDARRGPALASACMLCSALAATEVLKLACRRGRPASPPHGLYADPFRGRMHRLRARPSLTRTLRGRFLRYLAFRRFPALAAMHEREISERTTGLNAAEPLASNVAQRAKTEQTCTI
jgi:hypothetical protein